MFCDKRGLPVVMCAEKRNCPNCGKPDVGVGSDFDCPYCGKGFCGNCFKGNMASDPTGKTMRCPHCEKPMFFSERKTEVA